RIRSACSGNFSTFLILSPKFLTLRANEASSF
ncbi:MAG: hypothetical protein ACI9JR_002737, partial [Gammaproteobacteria bacterium]